jgi:hypothetical protein
MGEVVDIADYGGETRLDIDPDKVLMGAVGHLGSVVVIGWDKDDQLFFAASNGYNPDTLWLIECARRALIDG